MELAASPHPIIFCNHQFWISIVSVQRSATVLLAFVVDIKESKGLVVACFVQHLGVSISGFKLDGSA
jgi:hypothetical protein